MNEVVDNKIKQLKIMIADLKNNEKVITRIGGHTTKNLGEEVKMQTRRLKQLNWTKETAEEEIRAKRQELLDTLQKDEKDCIYGIVRGLPPETIETIAKIEDLELALGIHPVLEG